MFERLQNNFHLSMISAAAVLGCLGILPYAAYRALHGHWLVAITDLLMVLASIIAVWHAWRTDETEHAGLALSLIGSLGAVVVTLEIGVNGLFWLYVLILFNFSMVEPRRAMLITVAVLLSVATLSKFRGLVFESNYQMLSFGVTSGVASLFAYVFAERTRTQREWLERLVAQDPLTGAGNRRSLKHELQLAIASQARYGERYGLLSMDLDHFKQVNDSHGHAAGDQVLIDFVQLVRNCSRRNDRLFRVGGEEFLLLVPKVGLEGLQGLATQLQQQIDQRLRSPGGPVTTSMGGALLRRGESAEQWLQRADYQLYRAKHAGRNCIFIQDEPALPRV
jgi:diguanylate cyclase (GGDEF)-like protein